MTEPARLKAVNIDALEQDVQSALDRQRAGAAVEHVGEKDIDRLTAEATRSQWEMTAKAAESLGDEVKKRINNIEGSLSELHADLKLLGEAADAVRDKGKLVEAQIDEAANLSKDIRSLCADLRKKVVA